MGDTTWKAWERRIANDLRGILTKWGNSRGVSRSGPVGSNVPDIRGFPLISVEAKEQAKLALLKKDLDQTERNKLDLHMGALALKEKKTGRKYVVMSYTDWLILVDHATPSLLETELTIKKEQ